MPSAAAPEPMRSNRLYETGSFFLSIPGSKLPGYYRSVPLGQNALKLAPWSDRGTGTVSMANLASLIPGQRRTAGFLQRHPKPFFENQIAVELLVGSRIRLFVLSKFSFIDWLSAKHADEHVVFPL